MSGSCYHSGRSCLLLYVSAIAPMLLYVLICPNITAFLFLNYFHNTFFDNLFTTITALGDGLFISITAIFLITLKKFKRVGLLMLMSFLISGLLAQLLKNIFSLPRPMMLFQQIHFRYPYFIEGITNTGMNSFPSGHATSIFAICTVLSLHVSQTLHRLLLFSLALLVGYSRIYLGCHFPMDVMAGAILGGSTSFIVFHLYPGQSLIYPPFTNKGAVPAANPLQAS